MIDGVRGIAVEMAHRGFASACYIARQRYALPICHLKHYKLSQKFELLVMMLCDSNASQTNFIDYNCPVEYKQVV